MERKDTNQPEQKPTDQEKRIVAAKKNDTAPNLDDLQQEAFFNPVRRYAAEYNAARGKNQQKS